MAQHSPSQSQPSATPGAKNVPGQSGRPQTDSNRKLNDDGRNLGLPADDQDRDRFEIDDDSLTQPRGIINASEKAAHDAANERQFAMPNRPRSTSIQHDTQDNGTPPANAGPRRDSTTRAPVGAGKQGNLPDNQPDDSSEEGEIE